jgi:hypothetical protein
MHRGCEEEKTVCWSADNVLARPKSATHFFETHGGTSPAMALCPCASNILEACYARMTEILKADEFATRD